jgi:hypothetical protein
MQVDTIRAHTPRAQTFVRWEIDNEETSCVLTSRRPGCTRLAAGPTETSTFT